MKLPDQLEDIFREVWAINADVLSLLYSGTGALKTDFTRTGRRTIKGSIKDGVNSLLRYLIGNFTDYYRQNSINLLVGKIDPSKFKLKNPTSQYLLWLTTVF